MTEKLTFRELRMNLSSILDRMEEGEVFEVRGGLLGFVNFPQMVMEKIPLKEMQEMVKPALINPKPTIAKLQDMINEMQDNAPHKIDHIGPVELREGFSDTLEHDPCEVCRKRVQLYGFYEDTDHKLCEQCLRDRLGKGAIKYIIESNKILPQEPVRSVPAGLHRQAGKFERRDVKYCTACKFQAVSGNSSLCAKCSKKKAKK